MIGLLLPRQSLSTSNRVKAHTHIAQFHHHSPRCREVQKDQILILQEVRCLFLGVDLLQKSRTDDLLHLGALIFDGHGGGSGWIDSICGLPLDSRMDVWLLLRGGVRSCFRILSTQETDREWRWKQRDVIRTLLLARAPSQTVTIARYRDANLEDWFR